ncbi:serine acetyltransferase [Hanstruepera ponticola]|uniref:serine acetyltransferase n=1 Tax=Hanstruepera ponticola TaxID=2042995 RepID=UPI001CA87C5B|nr:serine acetyltransferase [Hanstruepera ponticola]
MRRLFKHLIRKLFLFFLYRKYVLGNVVIQEDVQQNILIRGSNLIDKPIKKQFSHLMHYYPEYAFLFFWRLKGQAHLFKRFFTKDFHCKIFKSTQIDGGLSCYHPFASVINAKSIGRNFQFRNGLTIGNKRNDNSLIPSIGHDVTVGAQVVIIGNITIGNNVIIGAGSVVVKDVPSNCVIAGNPAKIIKKL